MRDPRRGRAAGRSRRAGAWALNHAARRARRGRIVGPAPAPPALPRAHLHQVGVVDDGLGAARRAHARGRMSGGVRGGTWRWRGRGARAPGGGGASAPAGGPPPALRMGPQPLDQGAPVLLPPFAMPARGCAPGSGRGPHATPPPGPRALPCAAAAKPPPPCRGSAPAASSPSRSPPRPWSSRHPWWLREGCCRGGRCAGEGSVRRPVRRRRLGVNVGSRGTRDRLKPAFVTGARRTPQLERE
jgi:hypothetical protein